jgi:predicted RNA-binding Zn ribbon-like protein
LAVAETLLADGVMAEVAAALPDECAAASRLNSVLTRAGAIRLWRAGSSVRVDFVVHSALSTGAFGLAMLVVVDGWRRLKRCEVCGGAFVDRTNGCSRRRCAVHRVRNRRRR